MAQAVVASAPIAGAMAALPRFESLKYPTRSESAGRKARSTSPTSKGGGDSDQERRSFLPWGQVVWEDETGGRLGPNYDENYPWDKNVFHEILKIRVVRAARACVSFDGFRQYVKRVIAFTYK